MARTASGHAAQRQPAFLAQLTRFLRFPSVSAEPRHAGDLRACARWLADHLGAVGMEHSEVVETPGHPLVTADWRHAPGRPTVLVYGHFDVVPAGALADWHSPPFEPALRGGRLFGRGASDNKGPLFAHVKAIESYLAATGGLPVNVVCLFDGEEEIGSPHLAGALRALGPRLRADVAVVSDTRIAGAGRPAVTESLRGCLDLRLEVVGPARDLHSGTFGGAIANPAQALCTMIAGLHDRSGRVAIPGFYDRVRVASRHQRAQMAQSGPSDRAVAREAGVEAGSVRTDTRPTSARPSARRSSSRPSPGATLVPAGRPASRHGRGPTCGSGSCRTSTHGRSSAWHEAGWQHWSPRVSGPRSTAARQWYRSLPTGTIRP